MRLVARLLRPVTSVAAIAFAMAGCSQFGAVYPPRPPSSPGLPVADPSPSRVVAHVTVTSAGLRSALDGAIPKSGDGQFALLKTQRRYKWERDAIEVSFAQGRIVIDARVRANLDMPVGSLDFSWHCSLRIWRSLYCFPLSPLLFQGRWRKPIINQRNNRKNQFCEIK